MFSKMKVQKAINSTFQQKARKKLIRRAVKKN